jgi:hypothetical protein
MKMVKGLLLDRIDGERARLGVHLAYQRATMITPTATDTCLAIAYLAVMRTKFAFYPHILQSMIISALHQKTIAS